MDLARVMPLCQNQPLAAQRRYPWHVANFSAPLPHLDVAKRPELPPPNEGPVQWRERWSLVLNPLPGSGQIQTPVPMKAELQFDLPDRLAMLQDGEVTGFVTGRLTAPPLTSEQGVVLSRGSVTVMVGNVAPMRALALELCWASPDGRYCMLNGHGSGLRMDGLDGIQLGLRFSWRKETAVEALGLAMTFLLTRILNPSQLPPPEPEPEGLWKRLTGKFKRPG